MPHPTLEDDGRTVTLDLHGASVPEAMALVDRVVAEAARRGRATVKIIHGQSTSAPLGARPTIKQSLHDALDARRFKTTESGVFRADAYQI